ncbi:N-acetylmuramoyl-L-alanine amidase, partial [Sandarakinorhabdus sp.]|uniref:N-acetylmuramoyl-L-alanine amidase n=1 Tax=Sandarakinorhabdus sp. TaxID=1916663 RepID=UPI0035620A05
MRRILLILCLLWAAPGWAARIIALDSQPGRVIVTADGPLPAAKAFALSDPFRLVVDFVGIVGSGLSAPGTNSVASLRAAMFAPGTARLVIDLRAPVIIREARAQGNQVTLFLERVPPDLFVAQVARGRRPLPLLRSQGPPPPPTLATGSFSLPPEFGRPREDAAQPIEKPAEQLAPDKAVAAPPKPPVEPPAVLPPAVLPTAAPSGTKSRTGGKPLVVIDAGHGGRDVGAISVLGGYEKTITLSIARETARILRDRGRVRVKLTRDDDRFIPLGGRVRIARDARADLFISIHADSAPNDQARGASVYTLSAVASDAIA